MSKTVLSGIYTLWDWYMYLVSPPSDSWVSRVASMFWVFALMLFLPMAFITGLDIASWVVMRTLGNISPDLPPSVIVRNIASDQSSAETSPTESTSKDPFRPHEKRQTSRSTHGLNLKITPTQADSTSYFGGAHLSDHSVNRALAGEGIFSPIPSRATSPVSSTTRRRSRAPSNATVSSSSSYVDLAESTGTLQSVDALRKRTAHTEQDS
ncbi:hypothetical protein BKA62DRAFT_682479 [Auriculariales sp. MPI-PUGE-AT-0066]|nr:hypothetical protein BKA62DRAFT_682479 [Auriculariales sp. MPI-PUGE-AT-0066]